jgi:hypothetical protein
MTHGRATTRVPQVLTDEVSHEPFRYALDAVNRWPTAMARQALLRPGAPAKAGLAAIAMAGSGWELFVVPTGRHLELGWTPLQVPLGSASVLAALVMATMVIVRMARARPALERMVAGGD